MIAGSVCKKHPELNGRRYSDGHCPGCVREWRVANKEKVRASNRKHYQKNQEKYRAAARVKYAKNPKAQADNKKAWVRRNREKVRKANTASYTKYPDKAFERRLRRSGFTPEIYFGALSAQKNKCAVCGSPLDLLNRKYVHADHDHAANTPRGILCHLCNVGLGSFRDSPENLISAAIYLISPTIKRRHQ